MPITARVKVEDLEATKVSITLTMTLTDWRKAMHQLPSEWPSWKIGALVSEAIGGISRNTDILYTGKNIE
jgi:hypothetical protein